MLGSAAWGGAFKFAFSRLHGAEIKQVDQAREMVVADLSDEEAVGEVALELPQRPSQRDRPQPLRQAARHSDSTISVAAGLI